MEIGHNIQQRREDKGMSQQDLADYWVSRDSLFQSGRMDRRCQVSKMFWL